MLQENIWCNIVMPSKGLGRNDNGEGDSERKVEEKQVEVLFMFLRLGYNVEKQII
jgi:hypothetical protein